MSQLTAITTAAEIGAVLTLTGNTGGAVPPDGSGNINIVGSGAITVTGNPGTDTLTISGTTDSSSFVTNSGTAVPVAGVLNVLGTSVINTSGSGNTVDVNLTNGTNGQVIIGGGANPTWSTLTAGTGISITNGANSISIATSGTSTLTYTSVTTSPYVVLATDEFLGVTTSSIAIQINLPNAPATGRVYSIKDISGNAATNNITVTTVGGSVAIDGGTTFVMNTSYESVQALFNGTSYLIF